MTKSFCAILLILPISVTSAYAQAEIEPTPTPVKVVVTNSLPPPKHIVTPTPKPSQTPIIVGRPDDEGSSSGPNLTIRERRVEPVASAPAGVRSLGFGQIKSKIAEAKRQMQARPTPTAMTDSGLNTNWVRIAFNDTRTNQIDYVVTTKEAFLSTDEIEQAVSTNGRAISIRTIRGNGVNTPVVLTDDHGQTHLPLLVQYPVERGGKYMETAYYMSTHPGLVTPEVVNAGTFYVRNVIEIARDRLKAKGISVQPKIADIAERLATVEHVDHTRFRTEPHKNIFNDIFTLYALNEGQTYRYSVSSAGAGGMVQMIPATYRMVRSWHPNAGLMPDFVEGMRNHVNATQAMLLYMQRTWNDLVASPTVSGALAGGIATEEQLMAAGYNSNPARLAGYISRGGENWSSLIPRETRIYLQIYESIERHVPMQARTR